MNSNSYSNKYQDPTNAQAYDCGIYAPGSASAALWEVEQGVMDTLLKRYCPRHREADALDFACGAGRVLLYLVPRVHSLVGVDISQAMLDRAKTKVGERAQLICADIITSAEAVPGEKDLITSFRFLLLAEPELREACVRALARKLRSSSSTMILNSHGNPWSFRSLASLRNVIMRKENAVLPRFGVADMRRLARRCGLRLVATTGMGFVPGMLQRMLPRAWFIRVERWLAGRPVLWRLGTNLFFVCRLDVHEAGIEARQ
jgi:SAM-dependent methyltransferase